MQRTSLLSILIAGLFVAAPAHAQWYVGASAGTSDSQLSAGAQSSGNLQAQGFSGAQNSLDKNDTGYRVFGGFKFWQYFGVELGAVDLGKFRNHTDVSANPVGAGFLNNEIKVKGVDLGVTGSVPVGDNFSVFGRVGAFASEAKSAIDSGGSVALYNGSSANYKKRTASATYGVGVEYRLTPAVAIRGEWTRFEKIKNVDIFGREGDFAINLYGVGITYSF